MTGEVARTPSEEEWLRVSRYLHQHHYGLAARIAADYPAETRVAGTPLLAVPAWHLPAPVPLDAVSGKLAWKYAIGDQIRCSPTVVDGRAMVAGCDGKLHIIRLDDIRDVAPPPLEQVKAQISKQISQEKLQAYEENLRKQAKIQ